MINTLIRSIITLFTADFLTGIVHWWEDAYGNPQWKFLGKAIIQPNLLHHKKPREFLKSSYWSRINTSLAFGLLLIVLCWLFSILNWYSFFCIFIAVHGNEIHRFAHRTDKENGKIICLLQKIGILQSRRHHGWHHKAPYECNYCIATNYLNPLLNIISFWSGLEWVVLKVFGIKVLRGSALRSGL